MSNSRSSSPASGPSGGVVAVPSGASRPAAYHDYQPLGAGLVPLPGNAPMLILPHQNRSSFHVNNWPSGLHVDASPLGSLSQRTSVDDISHFPSLSSDTEGLSQGGSFSGPSSLLSGPQGPTHLSHPSLLGILPYPDTRSGMSFMTSSSDTNINRDSVSGPTSASLPPTSNHQLHHPQSHEMDADHIGGEPQTHLFTPRSSWFYPGTSLPTPLTSTSSLATANRPASSPPDASFHPLGMAMSTSSSVQTHPSNHFGGLPHPHTPFSSYPLCYPVDFRPSGNGSLSVTSNRSDGTDDRDDPNSDSGPFNSSRDGFEELEEDNSLDTLEFSEDDLLTPTSAPTSARPKSKRARAAAARASLARGHYSSNSSTPSLPNSGRAVKEDLLGIPTVSSFPDRHKGTGRKKIEIKPINYKLKRQITFSKRKTGLLKKVRELTTLTQTEALVILVSETGNPHSYATERFRKMIRESDTKTLNSFLDSEEKKSKGGK